MTAPAPASYAGVPPGRPSGGQVALWASAGAAALALHAGLAVWALWAPPAPPGAAAPAAVMIEMAPDPMAPVDEPPEIAQDRIDQAEVLETSDRPDLPEVEPLDLPEPPPEDLPELAQDLPPDPDMTPVPVPEPEVALARPMARPERPKPVEKAETKEEKPVEQQRRAKAEAKPGPKVAAAANSSASQGGGTPAKWKSRLMAHLERRKRYPAAARSRRAEGTVHVSFSIDGAGNLLGASISRPSGHPELDAEVLALVRRASPMPPPPPDAPREVTAPIRFDLN